MSTARRLAASARALLPAAALALSLAPGLPVLGASRAAAQVAPTDLLLSAPGVGAIWKGAKAYYHRKDLPAEAPEGLRELAAEIAGQEGAGGLTWGLEQAPAVPVGGSA